jgi:hypothetical protein
LQTAGKRRPKQPAYREPPHALGRPRVPLDKALALTDGATLVSCDLDFARFKGLRWENPLA